jgi:hypothetical protein
MLTLTTPQNQVWLCPYLWILPVWLWLRLASLVAQQGEVRLVGAYLVYDELNQSKLGGTVDASKVRRFEQLLPDRVSLSQEVQ